MATLKAIAGASVFGISALVAKMATWRGVNPLRAAAFVALNPLVLVHVVGGAHNDGLTMLLATLAVAAILGGREAAGGAALVAAVATKLSAAFLAPFALLGTTGRNDKSQSATGLTVNSAASNRPVGGGNWSLRPVERLLLGLLAAALAIGGAAYLAFDWHWLHGFGLAGENQSRTSHLSIPTTVARISGLGPGSVRLAAALLFAALVIYLLAWTWRGGDWVRAAAWVAFALLIATAWLLPWYLLWPLPLAAISRDRTLQLLTLLLTAYQLGARIPL